MSSELALHLPTTALGNGDAVVGETPAVYPSVGENTHALLVGKTDEQLLQALANGYREALSVLFQRHARAVYGVAWRILRNESEAADLRQDVFLYLFQKASFYDPKRTSAISWIMQVVYARAIDRRRYLTYRHHVDADEVRESVSLAVPNALTSADHLDGKALLSKLRQQLSPEQRKTLELHILEGYSFREIAERSGQTLGNVRHHYYRAIERLRANLFSRTE